MASSHISIYRDTDRITFIHDGLVVDIPMDEYDDMRKSLNQSEDEMTSSAFLMLTKQHPMAEIVAMQSFIDMMRQGDIPEDSLTNRMS